MKTAFEIGSGRFKLVLSADGTNGGFIDLRTGLDHGMAGNFASVKSTGVEYKSDSLTLESGTIAVGFAGIGCIAKISSAVFADHVTFELTGLEQNGAEIDEMSFCDFALGLEFGDGSDFVPVMLAMNLKTNVDGLPGFNNRMGAKCCKRFGFIGAKAAIAAGPEGTIRGSMKAIALEASASGGIPHSPLGGPWAMDGQANRGSYCFNFDGISIDEADEWIEMARMFGIRQIDFHGGQSFRFGDCRPDPVKYPEGYKSLKAVIDRIHDAGMMAGLHTYAFFMDKKCEWVTPVPRPDLGYFRTFTLAEPLDESGDTLTVNESTEGMTLVTGFFERNSTSFRIGNELISYTGIEKTAPYRFTGCKRGIRDTGVSAHAAGEEAFLLKECFGLFTPGADTQLFTDVCARTAEIYNECGFDMMYFDALDGEDILAGQEYSWHYGSKFIFEIVKRIKKPAVIEYSTHHHHLWFARSRMGAWDTTTRSYKRFVDVHVESNTLICDRQYLPGHLGWWAVNPHETIRKQERDTQYERMFEDDVEYLCCKCAAHDYSLSMMGIEKKRVENNKGALAYAAMTKMYEDLRAREYFTDEIKAMLAVPKDDFRLRPTDDGKYSLSRASYSVNKVSSDDPESSGFKVDNPYGPQRPFIRIEALMTAEGYDSDGAIALTGKTSPEAADIISASPGGKLEYTESDGELIYNAAGAWTGLQRQFETPANLGGAQAIGLWICGDGKGEVVNFRLNSPKHLTYGFSDHMVRVDFTGWKYFMLVENDGGKMDDVVWPGDMERLWNVYREGTHFTAIESVFIMCSKIPEQESVNLRFRDIKAIPVLKNTVSNPSVSCNGSTNSFDAVMESGSYLEYVPENGECKHFDSLGGFISDIAVSGGRLTLSTGSNVVTASVETPAVGSHPARCKVTLRTEGEPHAFMI